MISTGTFFSFAVRRFDERADLVIAARRADAAHFVRGLFEKRQPDGLQRQIVRDVVESGCEYQHVAFADFCDRSAAASRSESRAAMRVSGDPAAAAVSRLKELDAVPVLRLAEGRIGGIDLRNR